MSHSPTHMHTHPPLHRVGLYVPLTHTSAFMCTLTRLCTVSPPIPPHTHTHTHIHTHTHTCILTPPLHRVDLYVPLIPVKHELRRDVCGVVQVDRLHVVRPRPENQVTALLVVRKSAANKIKCCESSTVVALGCECSYPKFLPVSAKSLNKFF